MVDVVMKRNPISGRERPQEKEFDERRKVVRVLPRDENMRKYLKHAGTKVGFLAEGSAEWPNDQFTRRRIKEGDVTIEEAAPKAAPEGEGEPQAVEATGAKAAAKAAKPRSDKEAPAPETSATVDPNKTSAPKT